MSQPDTDRSGWGQEAHPERRRRRPDLGLMVACILGGLIAALAIAHATDRLTTSVVSGNSMLPYARGGDLLVAKPAPQYVVGDVVILEVPEGEPGAGQLVAHRIVSSESGVIRTQGDNRDTADLWDVRHENVRGKVFKVVPSAGFLKFARQPVVIGLAVAILTIAVLSLFLDGHRRDDPPEDEPDQTPRRRRVDVPPDYQPLHFADTAGLE